MSDAVCNFISVLILGGWTVSVFLCGILVGRSLAIRQERRNQRRATDLAKAFVRQHQGEPKA